ncbi:MAG: archease [bacterium]
MSDRTGWRRLEHTADLLVEFRAADRAGLFRVAVDFLAPTLLGRPAEPRLPRHVSLRSADPAELFLDWLRELAFLLSTGFVPARVEELDLSGEDRALRARLVGEELDPARGRLRLEIKGPTYHGFAFGPDAGGFRAKVLFDV